MILESIINYGEKIINSKENAMNVKRDRDIKDMADDAFAQIANTEIKDLLSSFIKLTDFRISLSVKLVKTDNASKFEAISSSLNKNKFMSFGQKFFEKKGSLGIIKQIKSTSSFKVSVKKELTINECSDNEDEEQKTTNLSAEK